MLMQNVGNVTYETDERTTSTEQDDESQGRIVDELVFHQSEITLMKYLHAYSV